MRRLNIPQYSRKITAFISKTVKNAGIKRAIVAVSGGVDSATSVNLTVRALGRDSVYGLLLPYKDWHADALRLGKNALQKLEFNPSHMYTIDIAPIIDGFVKVAGTGTAADSQSKLRFGNAMARARMMLLYDLAKKLGAIVVGTENKSEHLLGYYTRFGDEASDIEPLRQLYKTEVYELAKYLEVPEEIRLRPPTAGLWQGQTDEGEFGFSYQVADEILYRTYDLKKSEAALVRDGFELPVIRKIISWVARVSFKHHLPYLPPKP